MTCNVNSVMLFGTRHRHQVRLGLKVGIVGLNIGTWVSVDGCVGHGSNLMPAERMMEKRTLVGHDNMEI